MQSLKALHRIDPITVHTHIAHVHFSLSWKENLENSEVF